MASPHQGRLVADFLSLRQPQFDTTARSKSERFGRNAHHPARVKQIGYCLKTIGPGIVGERALRFDGGAQGSVQSRFRIRNEITEYDLRLLSSNSHDPGIDSIDDETAFRRVACSFTIRGVDLNAQRG